MSEPSAKPYDRIVRHYEQCLHAHASGPLAVNWKSEQDAETRYDVMLGVVRQAPEAPIVVVDLGCGLGGLRDHMEKRGLGHLGYFGIDVSEAFVMASRQRRPDLRFEALDVLDADANLPTADYVVLNGVFTRREDLSEEHMADYMVRLATRAFEMARIGIAFNVMSSCVDWKTDSLFHPEIGLVARLACQLSGHYVLRNDYGLYETTCYVYREPVYGNGGAK
jgi:SAM-dependent methyltransferase